MPIVSVNGIEIAYESHGDDGAPAILLIMGLGGQLTMWPDDLINSLVSAGRRVITFDNRDIGLSAKFADAPTPNPIAQMLLGRFGIKLKTPYTLTDMADDAAGLLEVLGIERADIVGISMGGMIGQFLSAKYPQKVASLTAIMTTTGNPKLPHPGRDVMKAMLRRGPAATEREEIIAQSVATFALIGTPGEDHNTNGMRDRIAASVDRNHAPAGLRVQTAAILGSGDFRNITRQITVPTLVIHGSADPLVSIEGGKDVAKIVPGARFEIIDGMGHDIPPRFLPRVIALIHDHLGSARVAASAQ